MMIVFRYLTLLLLILCSFMVLSQGHASKIKAITTVEEAEAYAASYRDVMVSVINAETDVMFFDDIDTSNMEQHVGTFKSFFGRTTKLLKATSVNLVNVQVIGFNLSGTSREDAESLRNKISERLNNGASFWDLKKEYGTSAEFMSSPENVSSVIKTYNVSESDLKEGHQMHWESKGHQNKIGILIVETKPHDVPAFYAISFINI